MTASVVDKLKLCFSVGMNDEQSCYFCQISTDALYKYQRGHKEFIKEKEVLKESITMQARVNI
jgi:wyosine [tRNA(Phe)-imidazoG37] synthetase (radical SAM superfamily)